MHSSAVGVRSPRRRATTAALAPAWTELHAAANALAASAARVPVGGLRVTALRPASPCELDARAALLERRMAAHHVELASTHKLPSKLRAAAAGASSAAASAASLAELERHADELRTRLRRAGTRAEIQATLVERVREVDVYDDALNSAQPSAKQRELLEAVAERDAAAVAALRASDVVEAQQWELADLQRRTNELLGSVRGLREQLSERTGALAGLSAAARKAIDEQLLHNTILRNVFQMIVLESGVDWGADDELCELMMSLSTPFDVNRVTAPAAPGP